MVINKDGTPISFRDKALNILIMGIRDFIRDGRNISTFHFNEETGEIEAEKNEQFFRKENGEIIKEVFEWDRMRSYHLNHDDTSNNMAGRNKGNILFSAFLDDYNMN